MSSEASERMLGLLKELSVYKLMDEDDRACPKSQETDSHQERERRRQETMQEMRALAAASKADPT